MREPTKVKIYFCWRFCQVSQLEIAGGARRFLKKKAAKKRWSTTC